MNLANERNSKPGSVAEAAAKLALTSFSLGVFTTITAILMLLAASLPWITAGFCVLPATISKQPDRTFLRLPKAIASEIGTLASQGASARYQDASLTEHQFQAAGANYRVTGDHAAGCRIIEAIRS